MLFGSHPSWSLWQKLYYAFTGFYVIFFFLDAFSFFLKKVLFFCNTNICWLLKRINSYFWLCWVFIAAHRLSLVAASRGYSADTVHGLLIVMASLAEHRLYDVRASVVVAHRLNCPEACGISLIRYQTHVPCIDRQILYHWTTRAVSSCIFQYPL